jgi:hypothetical protein
MNGFDATPALVKAIAAEMNKAISLAHPTPRGTDMARRLLTDPKMRNVWTTLRRIPAKPWASAEWRKICEIYQRFQSKLSDEGASLQDKACAVFFFYALISFGGMRIPPPRVLTRKLIDERREQWLAAAQMCWDSMHVIGEDGIDAGLPMALALVGEHFEQQSRIVMARVPYSIERSSKDRGDDEVRVQVRFLAVTAHRLFGQYLCGTIATVATVALQTVITEKSTKNWCAALRRP